MPIELLEIFAPLPDVERGKAFVLGGDPKGKNILYASGTKVIIRSISNPKKADVYIGHSNKTTVAKYAHHGNYICSGDEVGKIHIWDALGSEHKLKYEFRPFAGEIRDLTWGPESKRIVLCGKGNQKNGAAIMWDSGNNVGEIKGIEKAGNSIDYKPNRPYRVAAGDDGFAVLFYAGPPFALATTRREHSRFAQCVRFSPDGKYFASGSSDCRVYLYDGKTAELIGQLGEEKTTAHAGGVYSLSWSPDGKELLTASGDKSCKIWDIETKKEVAKFVLGSTVSDQQYSCIWVGDTLISVSLSGCFNYLDRSNPEKPLRVVHGHRRPVTKIINLPMEKPCHVSGDASGKLLIYDTEEGEARPFSGDGHTSKITGLAFDAEHNDIVSIGFDDKIRFTDATKLDFSSGTTVCLDSQPSAVSCAGNGCVVVNTEKSFVLLKNKKKVFELQHHADFTPACMDAHGGVVAAGKYKGGIQLFEIQCDSLVSVESGVDCHDKPVTIAFSPDGSLLAVGYENKLIKVYLASDGYKQCKQLVGHHRRPIALAWSPDSEFLASSGFDGDLRVWNLAKDDVEVEQKAHGAAFISCLAWQGNSVILSGGDDFLTKLWKVTW